MNKHHVAVGRIGVYELAETFQLRWIFQRRLPFAGIGLHDMRHLRFQFLRDAQAVLNHYLAQVVDAAFRLSSHTEVRCRRSAVRT